MPFAFELIIILFMLALNAVFAAYEMALASLSRARISVLMAEKKKGADAAASMKDRMEASLAVIQLGITLVGAIAAATGGAGIEDILTPYLENRLHIMGVWAEVISVICLVIPLSFFTIIFGELIPKMFALDHREWVCLTLSPMMRRLADLTYPIVRIFEAVVKKVVGFGSKNLRLEKTSERGLSELKAAASLAKSSRLIGAHEEKIVLSAAYLSFKRISSIMLPAQDIAMIPLKSSLPEALVKAHMDMHTRFPVCEKESDPQSIKGYVNFKDIVLALKVNPSDPTIEGITRPIFQFDSAAPISEVLNKMIHDKTHIALVCSQGQTEGLVTLEDIIEELVGEIEDEYDRLPTYIHPYGTNWLIGGGAPLYIVERISTIHLSGEPHPPTLTINDWCLQHLNRFPQGGDMIEDGNVRVMIRKVRRKKVFEAVLSSSTLA